MTETADVKVLISYSRKKELESKERELAKLKQGSFQDNNELIVKSICNHIEEVGKSWSGGRGGQAAKYWASVAIINSIRKFFLNIPEK